MTAVALDARMPAMPHAKVDGVRIAYEEAGDGFPIVFAHEFAGSMESWEAQVAHFGKRYRTITYNAVGYMPSDVPDDLSLYEQPRQIANLRGLLDHLGIARAHVVGLSMGAHMALGFALAHPEMVAGLVAAGAGTGSTGVPAFREDAARRAEQLEAHGMEALRAYASGTTRSRFLQRDPEGWKRFTALLMGHSAKGSANTLRGFQGRRPPLPSLEAAFREMSAPTLVIVGDEDDPCLEPSVFLKRAIPRCGLVVFPQTGHAVNIERPGWFNAVVDDFLAQVEAGGWPEFDPGSGDTWAGSP